MQWHRQRWLAAAATHVLMPARALHLHLQTHDQAGGLAGSLCGGGQPRQEGGGCTRPALCQGPACVQGSGAAWAHRKRTKRCGGSVVCMLASGEPGGIGICLHSTTFKLGEPPESISLAAPLVNVQPATHRSTLHAVQVRGCDPAAAPAGRRHWGAGHGDEAPTQTPHRPTVHMTDPLHAGR
jgi:hypothetical protein